MLAFTRLTSFLLFVLSLSFLTCALPTPAAVDSNELVARTGGANAVLGLVVDLKVKVEVEVGVLAACATLADVKAQVDVIVGLVEAVAKAILTIGAKIEADVELKAKIAAEVAAIINLIVQACLKVSVKFGLALVIALFAKIDICLHLLLINLGVCIEGIVGLVAKLVVDVSLQAILKLHLSLCASVLTAIGH
ncbi:hypothetical protein FRC07_008558 [Ceratobasidium sp. 392]|nr:hypothetical protein FRC07_008558 [Ceratobasidium sp. 392]